MPPAQALDRKEAHDMAISLLGIGIVAAIGMVVGVVIVLVTSHNNHKEG